MDVVLPDVAPVEADLTYPEHPVKMIRRTVSCGVKLSSSSKYNGATIPKKQSLGRVKNSPVHGIRTSLCHS
jgi:hypothetical protein